MNRNSRGYALSIVLTLTLLASSLIILQSDIVKSQGTPMTFTTGKTISFSDPTDMTFWSGVSMKFGTNIQVIFIENVPKGVLEPCDFFTIINTVPPGYIMPPCSWWEILDPTGAPTGFEFHVDFSDPLSFHVDMVWPGPFQFPPGAALVAQKKIDVIQPCEYFEVHWPSHWYPLPCSWWEIIDPETGKATGFEFHVDWTNESCEFHIDEIIPGPWFPGFPAYEVEARRKIIEINPCDWFVAIDPAGFDPVPCSWWEIIDPSGAPTGFEFHVDEAQGGAFHVDQVWPEPPIILPWGPSYTVRVSKKVDVIQQCSWFKVSDLTALPQPCTWWRIINPDIGDVEFHVDMVNPDGTFHIDDVIPFTTLNPPMFQVIAEQKFIDIRPCDWFKVADPAGFLPAPCSWWIITSPSEWAGVKFHVDSNDGIDRFHVDTADPTPTPGVPPPWSVTAEPYEDDFYWKRNFADYATSGVPDFDQRQGGTYIWQDVSQQWSHCGPVAVANSLWWLDSEFEPNPIPPPIINDGFPLVRAYGQWDDHDPLNVPWLVEHLAYLMDTDGRRTGIVHSGTDVHDMEAGLAHYLSWTGVNPPGDANGDGIVDALDEMLVTNAMGSVPGAPNWNLAADVFPASTTYPPVADNIIDLQDLGLVAANMGKTGLFYEHTVMNPDFFFIEEEVKRCQDVVLLVGYWIFDENTGGWYREPGGHYVTVAGVDSTNIKLALSDPVQDAFENGLIPEGRIPVPHVHPAPEPPFITHNDAQYVSQDMYNVAQITPPWPPCPGGDWMLVNFASWRPTPPCFAVIESAVITSPMAEHDLAVINVTTSKQGCKPVPTIGRNYTLPINVTVENQGGFIESFFDVWVELSLGMPPPITVGPIKVASLAPGDNVTLTFNWNTTGTSFGNYTVTGVVETVSGEIDTADNRLDNVFIIVTMPGDINGDGIVDIYDAILLANAFNATPDRPNWNPNADLKADDVIDIFDALVLAGHYNQHV